MKYEIFEHFLFILTPDFARMQNLCASLIVKLCLLVPETTVLVELFDRVGSEVAHAGRECTELYAAANIRILFNRCALLERLYTHSMRILLATYTNIKFRV